MSDQIAADDVVKEWPSAEDVVFEWLVDNDAPSEVIDAAEKWTETLGFFRRERTARQQAEDNARRARPRRAEYVALRDQWAKAAQQARADLEDMTRQHDEARATKDMHKERYEVAERELSDLRARIEALPLRCYTFSGITCLEVVDGTFPGGAQFTIEHACLPCRVRAALSPTDPTKESDRG